MAASGGHASGGRLPLLIGLKPMRWNLRASEFSEPKPFVLRLAPIGGGRARMPADRSQEYRRLAAECMEWARRGSDLQTRASLVIMSQRWLEQAELAERDASERSSLHRGIQAAISEKLRTLYRPLNYLPPHFLALLSQLDGIRRRRKG